MQKVILFGSRARGDFGRASDIDLAAEGGNIPLFALDIEERVPTLLSFDVVDLSQKLSEKLKESIKEDGVLLYKRNTLPVQ